MNSEAKYQIASSVNMISSVSKNFTDIPEAMFLGNITTASNTLFLQSVLPQKTLRRNRRQEMLKDPVYRERLSSARRQLAENMEENSLHRLRLLKGFSQAQLSSLTGIFQPQLSRIESGKVIPTLETIAKLAKALGVPVDEIVRCLEKSHENH